MTSIDINECHENLDNCEMDCVNNNGNFTCACYSGYIPLNSTNCQKGIIWKFI